MQTATHRLQHLRQQLAHDLARHAQAIAAQEPLSRDLAGVAQQLRTLAVRVPSPADAYAVRYPCVLLCFTTP